MRRIAAGQEVSIEELEALPSLDELVLHYQPVVELASGRIVGFESLVRWQHPTEGLRYPGEFLPQAEATGFVVEIDRWARRQAATQLAAWQGTHGSPERLWMSVNLSATDISDPNLLDSISSVVSSTGIEPIDLVVEVTESVLLDDTQQTTDFLVKMKELGVRLALDDFGTAFSSLSYVRRFPFDLLKIDISFTAELPHSAAGHASRGGDPPPGMVSGHDRDRRGNRTRGASRCTEVDRMGARSGLLLLDATPGRRLQGAARRSGRRSGCRLGGREGLSIPLTL